MEKSGKGLGTGGNYKNGPRKSRVQDPYTTPPPILVARRSEKELKGKIGSLKLSGTRNLLIAQIAGKINVKKR